MTWINEALYPGWRQSFRIKQELARERSRYQEIVVFQSWSHGQVMMLDGIVQITQADEFAYQEMIVHVPLLNHGSVRRVLIIGAGDGGVLRRTLEHKCVAEATMVEIDEAVIRLARQHMPEIGGNGWIDPRSKIVIGDGIAFVHEAKRHSFDAILVDSTDPVGAGAILFTEEFYQQCARILAPGGILVNQCGVPFLQGPELASSTALRRAAFSDVGAYLVAAPTYIGGFMALGIASQSDIAPPAEMELKARAVAAGVYGHTRYWTPAVHRAAFALPPYISANLQLALAD